MTQFGSAARSAGFTRSLAALPAPPPKSGPAASPSRSTPATPRRLSSPVYDHTSTNVFVGDYGGFFYRVSSTAAVTKSAQIDFGAGLVAGPVVDSTAGKVYVFSSSDGSTSCTGFIPCSAVYLFATSFGPVTSGTEARVGSSQVAPPNPNPLFEGSFDSTYRASVNATGNLYVCGNTGGKPDHVSDSDYCRRDGNCRCRAALANATTGCSPVTDIPNPNATRRSDRVGLRRRANDRIGEQLCVRRMHPESQGSTLDAVHSLRCRPAGAGYKLPGSGRPMWQERREPLAQGHPNWNGPPWMQARPMPRCDGPIRVLTKRSIRAG